MRLPERPRKPIGWRGSSLADVRAFPPDARRKAGHQLGRLQSGLMPDDWKPLPKLGTGTIEIRIHTAVEHRVIVVTKFAEALYVLHAFEKKARKLAKHHLELAAQRHRDLISERRKQ